MLMNATAIVFGVFFVIFLFIALIWCIIFLCKFVIDLRNAFREQSVDAWEDWKRCGTQQQNQKYQPRWDFSEFKWWEFCWLFMVLIVWFSVWLIVEIISFVGKTIIEIIVYITLYSIACSTRDWWHKGNSNR